MMWRLASLYAENQSWHKPYTQRNTADVTFFACALNRNAQMIFQSMLSTQNVIEQKKGYIFSVELGLNQHSTKSKMAN